MPMETARMTWHFCSWQRWQKQKNQNWHFLDQFSCHGSHQNIFKNPILYIRLGRHEDDIPHLILKVWIVNWDTNIQYPLSFDYNEAIWVRNLMLLAWLSFAQLCSAWLSLAQLGSAWLSLAQLDFWVEFLAITWRVSVQSLLDMFILIFPLFLYSDYVINKSCLIGKKYAPYFEFLSTYYSLCS